MTLSIEASFAAHIEKDVFATTIMGTKGGAYVGDEGVKVFTDMDGKMVNVTPAFLRNVDAFAVKMQSWIDAIRGAANPSPGEDGLTVQKILDGIYESAEKGREVPLR
jgi:predicted dehydrogenase